MAKKMRKLTTVMMAMIMAITMMRSMVFADASTIQIHISVKNSVSENWTGDIEKDITLTEGQTGYHALVSLLDENGYKYDISNESWGHSINAIQGISNNTTDWSEYWSLYYNGAYASYGIDGYVYNTTNPTLADGDTLSIEFYSANASTEDASSDTADDGTDIPERNIVPAEDMYQDVMNIADAALQGDASGYGSEWKILALARAGRLNDAKAAAYYADVENTLKELGNAKLDNSYATTNARVVIAIASIGKNPTDVGGYNLFEPLSDMDYITNQGINAAAYALIAFDTGNYTIPTAAEGVTQTTRDALVQYILNQELEGGGWAYSGTDADPDLTAMVLESLAPYYNSSATGISAALNSEVTAAVERGITLLSEMQNPDGSYSSWGSANSNSIAQVITALTSLGIDPASDSRFMKNGYSMVDALSDYYVAGQGFLYTTDSEAADDYSLNQVAYALTAYERFRNNQTSLYNMSDVGIHDSATAAPAVTTTEAKDNSPKTGDSVPVAEIGGLLILAAAGIIVISRRKKA